MTNNKNFESLDDKELLALAIYGEARGESVDGKLGVGSVILNRVARGGWFGATVKTAILKPWQFSAFNLNDPNREKLELIALKFKDELEKNDILKECYWVALGLLGKWVKSNVGAATHYFANYIETPKWADKMIFVRNIGRHKFFLEE